MEKEVLSTNEARRIGSLYVENESRHRPYTFYKN